MRRRVVVYTRPSSMLSSQVEAMLTEAGVTYERVQSLSREEQDALLATHRAPGFPLVVVDGSYVGGFPEVVELHAGGRLRWLMESDPEELRRALVSATAAPATPSSARPQPPRKPSGQVFAAVRPPASPSTPVNPQGAPASEPPGSAPSPAPPGAPRTSLPPTRLPSQRPPAPPAPSRGPNRR